MKQIKMPPGGQNSDVLTIFKWKKQIGDSVSRGDVLLNVETDKATMDVESFTAGTLLEIYYQEGDSVKVGEVIALVGSPNESIPEVAKDLPKENKDDDLDDYLPINQVSSNNSEEKAIKQEKLSENLLISPRAKHLIKEKGISLDQLPNLDRPIKEIDILEILKMPSNETTQGEIVPLSSRRKVIAKRLTQSTTEKPTFTMEISINMTRAIEFREYLNTNLEKSERISYNDLIMKALVPVIAKFPYANAVFTEEGIVNNNEINIGIAVGVDAGLIVPVSKNVEKKTIREIAKQNRLIIGQAKSDEIDTELVQGGTITVSNLGMYGIKRFTAIINPPESCILAVGSVEDTPYFIDGEWKAIPIMIIVGTFDHRIIDGAYAANFMTSLKGYLEEPYRMLAEL